jgi:hypothetical protein
VCDAPQTCGQRPADARYSPNGRELVFRNADGSIEITSMAGACIWCVGSEQFMTRGSDPTFTPGGATITYRYHWLWELTPGSSRATRIRVVSVPVSSGRVSAVAWSPSGKPAVIRGGWLWTGTRKANTIILSKRFARGTAPAWSPDGRELAFTHNGLVFTTRTAGHTITRVARGSSPAFSPDGRALAYLNRDHQVTIRPLGHGRTRTLTKLRGRSLDWQPVTTVTRRGCAAGNGVVVARNGAATVRSSADTQQSHIGWNGCVNAVGIPFHLNGGFDGNGYNLALGHVALAGDYAAMQFVYTDKYMDYSDTVDVYDLRSGALVHSEGVPCPGSPCDVTSLAVNRDGFAAWDATDTPEHPRSNITAISCPTTGLCVAGDQNGHILVSTSPSEGSSTWTRLSPAAGSTWIEGVSCPTVALCVAVASDGNVYWSTDPTGGAAAWHAVSLSATTISGISCGSASLCVALGGQTAYTTTDPTGPASAWTAHPLTSSTTVLVPVSCSSSSLCVIGDSAGDVFASTDPADSSPSWTTDHVPAGGVNSVDCPTTGLCAAVTSGSGGSAVLTTTEPAGATTTWAAHSIDGFVASVTCAGTSLCLAVGGNTAVTTTDPTDASPSWTEADLGRQATVASCPAASLCFAAGGPDILTSQAPTGGASAWSSALVDALDCDPCLAETLTAVDDQGAHTLDTAPPGPGSVITNLQLTGDTLTWTHDGSSESATLH